MYYFCDKNKASGNSDFPNMKTVSETDTNKRVIEQFDCFINAGDVSIDEAIVF